MSLQSQHLNRVMRTLTVITVMILPFNLVSGFFGMNVQIPWYLTTTVSYAPFISLVFFSMTMSALIYSVFRYIGYI